MMRVKYVCFECSTEFEESDYTDLCVYCGSIDIQLRQETRRDTPVKMTKKLRALCYVERHNECSGVQVPHSAADYFMVCTCGCHEKD